uniref:Uncharacterized protein n=1 Tax=Anopheles merus TaxID=30066 RepID=A0A182UP18_ANOME
MAFFDLDDDGYGRGRASTFRWDCWLLLCEGSSGRPHGPTCFFCTIDRDRQFSMLRKHSFEYVLPSVPHTGSNSCGQILEQPLNENAARQRFIGTRNMWRPQFSRRMWHSLG